MPKKVYSPEVIANRPDRLGSSDRTLWKADHRELGPGEAALSTARAVVAEVIDGEAMERPPAEVERLLSAMAETGDIHLAARRIGMSDARARQIAASRVWADAMRYAFQRAGVTPLTVAQLLGEAMAATYPKLIREWRGRGKHRKAVAEIRMVPAWGTRLKAAQMYLELNLSVARIERLPEGEEAVPSRPTIVTLAQTGGKTREEAMALIASVQQPKKAGAADG